MFLKTKVIFVCISSCLVTLFVVDYEFLLEFVLLCRMNVHCVGFLISCDEDTK